MIELRTNNVVLRRFASVDVSLMLDTVASTFSFEGLLDMDDTQSKTIFKPFSYQDCSVWFMNENLGIEEKLITGTILNPGLSVQKTIRLSSISGYSKTGILEDVNIPPELYPLQRDGLGLDNIAREICRYFGLNLVVFENARVDAAKVFERVKAEPQDTIKSYLSRLATSRGITVAHDNLGRLILYKVLDQVPPSVRLTEDDQTLKVSISPNSQGMHSSITVIRQTSRESLNAGQATVQSPFVPDTIKRPLVKVMEFGDNIQTLTMAKTIAAREAKNFPITIEKEGWTINNKLIRSGFYIELTAPSIFLETNKLVVERIQFKSNKKDGETMIITAVLPCVYTGNLPSKSPFK